MNPESRITWDGPNFAWEVATLFPMQGHWDEEDYLALTDSTMRLIELTGGQIEFLPMPTELHQAILEIVFDAIRAFVRPARLGVARFAPLRLQTKPGKFRDPDIIFLLRENDSKRSNRFWTGADLVMEIVSDDERSRHRDYVQKRADYAEAGVAEYWIVDAQRRLITVLSLVGSEFEVVGEFGAGDLAASVLLKGFHVDVAETFAAGDAAIQ